MTRYIAFRFNIKMLEALGMWPSSQGGVTWYRYYTTVIVCVYLAFFTTVGLHVVHNWGNIDVVDSLSVTLTNITALTKLYMILLSRKKIDSLVAFIENGFSVENDTNEDVVEIKTEILIKSRRRTRTLTTLYCSLFVWTAIAWAFSPVTIPASLFDLDANDAQEETSSNAKRVLPFRSWIPFDTEPSPNYEIAYTIQVVLSTVEALCIAATDTFYMALIIHTSSLFQTLRRSVSQVTEQAMLELQRNELVTSQSKWGLLVPLLVHERKAEQMVQSCMVRYVKQHQALLEHCDELEIFMSPIIFIEYLVVSFNLCLVGFQATVMPMYSMRFVTVLGYMLCVLLQLFFLCLYGSELLEESTQVMNAVYDSKWYGCSKDFKRSVLLMIMRASRPVKLTAGKFGTLTLETFNELIQTSYSYFAVLRKLHEEKHTI